MTSVPLLLINQVTRRFGGLVAVNDVSFAVEQGEIFGVIGPNGAGKTTLFNTITGLIRPSNGEIYFQNESITQLQPFQIAERGIARTFRISRINALSCFFSAWFIPAAGSSNNKIRGRNAKARAISNRRWSP